MILEKERFIKDNVVYLVRYDNVIFKTKTYTEFLNVFYEGNYIDSIEKKEEFLIGLIEMVALINDFNLLIYDNYENLTNEKPEIEKNEFTLYKDNINSVINILNLLDIARVFQVIGEII